MCVWKERKESLKIEKQKFAGEQKDTDLINFTNVYLIHCLVFGNLSQNTSISPSYHQHLGRWGGREGGREGGRSKGGRGEEVETGKKVE